MMRKSLVLWAGSPLQTPVMYWIALMVELHLLDFVPEHVLTSSLESPVLAPFSTMCCGDSVTYGLGKL